MQCSWTPFLLAAAVGEFIALAKQDPKRILHGLRQLHPLAQTLYSRTGRRKSSTVD
jgi:hypothetical protein